MIQRDYKKNIRPRIKYRQTLLLFSAILLISIILILTKLRITSINENMVETNNQVIEHDVVITQREQHCIKTKLHSISYDFYTELPRRYIHVQENNVRPFNQPNTNHSTKATLHTDSQNKSNRQT